MAERDGDSFRTAPQPADRQAGGGPVPPPRADQGRVRLPLRHRRCEAPARPLRCCQRHRPSSETRAPAVTVRAALRRALPPLAGTVDEKIVQIAHAKLSLGEAVLADAGEGATEKAESRTMAEILRGLLEEQEGGEEEGEGAGGKGGGGGKHGHGGKRKGKHAAGGTAGEGGGAAGEEDGKENGADAEGSPDGAAGKGKRAGKAAAEGATPRAEKKARRTSTDDGGGSSKAAVSPLPPGFRIPGAVGGGDDDA